jgi:integrase
VAVAVVPRKRKGGTVYGVLTSWAGGKHWELVGKNRREAEQLDGKRLREVAAGTFRPGEFTDAASFRTFADRWLEQRSNRSADNDRALLRRHVLSVGWFASMRLSDIRPRHVLDLVKELERGKLAPKSVALVMGIVRVLFRDAVIGDVIVATPYVIPRGTLKRSGKRRAPYDAAEVRALLGSAVGERERVWNAIAFYTGARCGEVCGLRWGDLDLQPVPLPALTIERQYAGQVLKTERPRVVPVHPELVAVLAAWRARWPLYFLRQPGPLDLICPRLVTAGEQPESMTKSAAYKGWLRSCAAAGVQNRSVHSTRHTFITHAQRGGADHRVVELVTHNPKGTIIDVYTTRDWSELCAAVLCLSFDAPLDVDGNGSGNSGSSAWTRSRPTGGKARQTEENQETGEPPGTAFPSGDAEIDAPVDARRTDAVLELAVAARAALHGGSPRVHWVIEVRKGAKRDAG